MSQVYTASEISAHNSEKDMWVVYKGKVYDISKYADEHPGGLDTLIEQAGKDVTKVFDSIGHSKEAKETLGTFVIGEVDPNDTGKLQSGDESSTTSYRSFIVIAAVLAVCMYMIVF